MNDCTAHIYLDFYHGKTWIQFCFNFSKKKENKLQCKIANRHRTIETKKKINQYFKENGKREEQEFTLSKSRKTNA